MNTGASFRGVDSEPEITALCGGEYTMRKFPMQPVPAIPSFQSVLSLWAGKIHDGRPPAWHDFDFDELLPWVGSLSRSVFDGDQDFVFRLFGGEYVSLFGRELTGKKLCGNLAPELIEATQTHLLELISRPAIGWTTGFVPLPAREHVEFNVLDLPLSDRSGATVSEFLHALVVKAD